MTLSTVLKAVRLICVSLTKSSQITAEVLMVIITRAYEFIKHFDFILPITYLDAVTHLQMLDGQ